MKTLFEDNEIWTDRILSHPERTIRLGSLFSGIGAIEHALKRLNIKTEIQFASDIDANCKKSYFANYEISEERWCDDVFPWSVKDEALKILEELYLENLLVLYKSASPKFSSLRMYEECSTITMVLLGRLSKKPLRRT